MGQDGSTTGAPSKRRGAIARFMIRTTGGIHPFMYRHGMARKMGQMQQVLLTTTGRKSGKPQTVTVGTIREGDGWIVIGSNGGADFDPNWWLNMVANPNVTLQVNDEITKGRMQEITNASDYERIWNAVVANQKGYANYPKKTSRKIPLGWIRPV